MRPLSTTRTVVVFCFFQPVPSSSTVPSFRRRARTHRSRPIVAVARPLTVTAVASPRLLSILLASSQTRFTRFAASAFVSRARIHVRTSAVRSRTHRRPPSSDASVHSSVAVRIAPARARAREPAKRRARPTPSHAQLSRRLPLASIVRSSRGRGLRADADFANHRYATDRLASSRVVARSSDDRARS